MIDNYFLSRFAKDTDSGNVRVWSFIVWEESVVPDWIVYLEELHIPAVISPLHDKDVFSIADPAVKKGIVKVGDYKKPHYHVILNFCGKKSYSQVKNITDSLNAGFPIRVHDIGAMTRYLIHEDELDQNGTYYKYHYNKDDIIILSGFDFELYFECPKSKIKQYIREMSCFIEDNNILYFYQLQKYCLFHNPDWYFVLMQVSTNAFVQLLKSRREYIDYMKGYQVKADQDGVMHD